MQPESYENRFPSAAVVLIFVGASFYLAFAIGSLTGSASIVGSPLSPAQSVVILESSIVILACGVLLVLAPRRHALWGVFILAASAFAIAIDGSILVNVLNEGLGGILASAPLAVIVLGGIFAILWGRSAVSVGNDMTQNIVQAPTVVGPKPSILSRVGLRGRGIIAAIGLAVGWASGFIASVLYGQGQNSITCSDNGCAALVVIAGIGYYSAVIAGLFFAYGVLQKFRASRKQS